MESPPTTTDNNSKQVWRNIFWFKSFYENNREAGIVVTNLHTKSEQNFIHVTDLVCIVNMHCEIIVPLKIFTWLLAWKALLDNYVPDELKPEVDDPKEASEEDDFINTIAVAGGPMDIAFKYLKAAGKTTIPVRY